MMAFVSGEFSRLAGFESVKQPPAPASQSYQPNASNFPTNQVAYARARKVFGALTAERLYFSGGRDKD